MTPELRAPLAVNGIVKRAYPLRLLTPTEDKHEDDAFSLGAGPCGQDATHLTTLKFLKLLVFAPSSYDSYLIYFYDKWALRVQSFQRHYKLHIYGLGLVILEWEVGEDTEERLPCFIVAERHILRKALARDPRRFRLPRGMDIEINYEEPQRLPDSDQLQYLPPKTLRFRDLYSDNPSQKLHPDDIKALKETTAAAKRGKRTLREVVAGTTTNYRYTCLGDLIPGNSDIYGVVVNMKLPKRSGGKDFYVRSHYHDIAGQIESFVDLTKFVSFKMTLHVIDESCPRRENALQILVFYPTLKQMPKVLFVGDIIRFHKLQIKQYRDDLQGVSMARATRYLVIRECSEGALKQQSCSENWTFEESDEQRVRELIQWSRESLKDDITLPSGCPQAPRLLADLKFAEEFVDILVRVLYIENDEPTRLIIWDGSGRFDASNTDLVSKLQNVGVEVPSYGVLKEIIMGSCWIVITEMGFVEHLPNYWCRFRNLAIASGNLSDNATSIGETLYFREVSSLILVPDYDTGVQSRLASRPPTQGSTDSATALTTAGATLLKITTVVPDHIRTSIPITMLQEIKESTQVPRKYHCAARFVKMWPTQVDKICKLKETESEYIYSFVIQLEDSSGTLDVILYGKDAEHFLHGIPPCDLARNTSSKSLLEKRFAALWHTHDMFHCCIKSYFPLSSPAAGQSDAKKARFRMFDTLLEYQ